MRFYQKKASSRDRLHYLQEVETALTEWLRIEQALSIAETRELKRIRRIITHALPIPTKKEKLEEEDD